MADDLTVEDLKDKLESDLFELAMEYQLTLAFLATNGDTVCIEYLIGRKDVLLPEIVNVADKRGIEPAVLFHGFFKDLHSRLHEGEDQ